MSKGQVYYWLSFAVLAFAPLAMAIGPLGFFEGGKGD